MICAPMEAAFCTVSIETRLLGTTNPACANDTGVRQGTGKLVERIVTADILLVDGTKPQSYG
jgi:hypothetical protein